jgi:polysaccharide biosynthesis protein PslG
MWNEWNGMVGNTHRGAAQDYVRFLEAVYPAVKRVDPSAVFIGGAIGGFKADWLAAMAAAGGLRFCDALSIHPYNFDQPARNPDGWAQELLATEGIVHRYTGGHDVPLYITEMGWPTYNGPGGSSLEEQASFLAQMFLLARTMPFLRGIWWYDLRDDGWNKSNKEDNFGLVDPNLKPKPAFAALRAVAPIVRGASRVEQLPAPTSTLHAIRFQLAGKQQVLALWNATPGAIMRVHVMGVGPLQVQRIGANTGNGSENTSAANNATVELTDSPVLITGANLAFNNAN